MRLNILIILLIMMNSKILGFRNIIENCKSVTCRLFCQSKNESKNYHIPVMLKECLNGLNLKADNVYIDCTLGGGGHTKAILECGGRVIALDQDPDAINKANNDLKEYIDMGKLEIFHVNFRNIAKVLPLSKLALGQPIDGVLMDLGISSHQIDVYARGFSFGGDGPLDMRMHQGALNSANVRNITADDIVNNWKVDDIADILFYYGDETRSRAIAREIVASRPIHSTGDLEKAISKRTSFETRMKTLARCFQALRIEVNDEIGALEEALLTCHQCIKFGGRLVIMSYHSLEDRRVKQLIKTGKISSRDEVDEDNDTQNELNPWRAVNKKAISPTEEEQNGNRRSRSAKLRIAERIDENKFENSHLFRKSFIGKKQAKLSKQAPQETKS